MGSDASFNLAAKRVNVDGKDTHRAAAVGMVSGLGTRDGRQAVEGALCHRRAIAFQVTPQLQVGCARVPDDLVAGEASEARRTVPLVQHLTEHPHWVRLLPLGRLKLGPAHKYILYR